MQEKREKGFCFRCDGKWLLNHICTKRELSVLLVKDVEQDDEEADVIEPMMEEDVIYTTVGISLNSVVGLTNPKTMKLVGKVMNQEVIVMIDQGTTNNFISSSVVERLSLPIASSERFGVTLGTGEEVVAKGVCRGVMVELQGIKVCEEFLDLELGNSDVIMGLQ